MTNRNKIKVVCVESDSEVWIKGEIYEGAQRWKIDDKEIIYYSFGGGIPLNARIYTTLRMER
jgi:hypothetical protein